MAVFSFDPEELEGIAPLSAQEQYLKKFGFTLPPLPDGFSHLSNHSKDADSRMTPPPSPGRVQASAHTQEMGFGAHSGGEHVNMLVAKRNTKKKRVQPTFLGSLAGSVPSAANPPPVSVPSATATASAPPKTNGRSFHEVIGIPSSSRPAPPPAPPPEPLPSSSSYGASGSAGRSASEEIAQLDLAYPDDVDMNTDVQISSLEAPGKGKRKASDADLTDDRPVKPRTLGGDRVRGTVTVRELAPSGHLAGNVPIMSGAMDMMPGQSVAGRLPMPPLLTYLKAAVAKNGDIFEARNSEDGSKQIAFS